MDENKTFPLKITLDNYYFSNMDELLKNEDFKTTLTENTFNLIKEQIDDIPQKIHICTIMDLGINFYMRKSQYKKFLENILNEYEKNEDFPKCKEISTYLNKI